ncbi:MAG: radical SAM family heme chaperone HemW [Candidatus Accumulibacter sp.]|jgi:oxygen-independent coproporphyrinogen-3 oxidase|nr:radical SAM family heme chaperone HemW [Accumulibacter sp.]
MSRRVVPIQPAAEREFRAPPLSLYMHIPWCARKCPYCDFNSHPLRGSLPEADYVAALIADLEWALPLVRGRRIVSVFIGGGTPSLLSAAAVDTLLAAVRARLPLGRDAEITLEANPGAIEAGKFAAFRDAGVNRLSLGIQSFAPERLQALGRVHDAGEALSAAALAARHFDRFNLDLMYGLPGQSVEQALADVKRAIGFAPAHLSCYQLGIEANTAFAASPPALPDPDRCADMQEAIETALGEAGFLHYETSAFARPGAFCRHNLNYWTFGDYLGIGAGAHGKLTLCGAAWQVRRQARWRHPAQYLAKTMEGHPAQEEFPVNPDELPFEFMMNALRLTGGFDASLFEERTAQPLCVVEPILRLAEEDGLIVREAGKIIPSLRGQRFLNRLLERFLA